MPRESQKVKLRAGDGGEITVTVFELSVADIRDWLRRAEKVDETADADGAEPDSFDPVGAMLYRDISFDDIHLMTDLTAETLEGLYQSDLNKVRSAIKGANPDFFDMRTRLDEAIAGLGRTGSNASKATSSS